MLTQLNVHHLRNLTALSIQPTNCNLIIGDNGSGKTSLIEALYLLARGKSFRHYQPKRYISHGQLSVTIYASFDDNHSMAIQKSIDALAVMRIDNQTVYAQSLLTKRLPTLLIDPSSMDMLEVGSSSRRQLLDWLVFHVKPSFHSQWLTYQRLLKQRNTLLRSSLQISAYQRQELRAWDKELARHSRLITDNRQQLFDLWAIKFDEFINKLLPHHAPFIKLRFSAGYDTSFSLDELLDARIEQDYHMGYTRIGCHRADVQILWIEETSIDINDDTVTKKSTTIRDQAANVLSRGEKKLLITALKLSQLAVLVDEKTQTSNNPDKDNANDLSVIGQPKPIVLLDDIAAELDSKALSLLLKSLAQMPCQLFITNLNAGIQSQLAQYWPDYSLFHMKRGEVVDCCSKQEAGFKSKSQLDFYYQKHPLKSSAVYLDNL